MENLIIKYLNNSISAIELNRLRDWLEESENQTKYKTFVKLHYNLNTTYQSSPKEAYESIHKRIKAKERKSKLPFYLKIAAIFIISLGVLGLAYFTFQFSEQSPNNQDWVELELSNGEIQFIKPDQVNFSNIENHFKGSQVSITYSESNMESEEIKYNSLRVPNGKTFVVILSDGTKVTLNAGSSLRYPTMFSKHSTEREVYLNGEAFFEVAHEEELPFIVRTEDLDIRVLGTKFNFSAYQEDKSAYAVLVEGKIQAENPNDNTSLEVSPGYKVHYKDDVLKTEEVYIEKYTAWLNGELILFNDSFQVIQHKLERKYDVEISNTYDRLNDIVINARFSKETVEQVLETFKAYKDFDYILEDNRIIISEPKNEVFSNNQ